MYENYICLLKGKEQFRLVSPIFMQNLYVGILGENGQYGSPLNFFDWNKNKFPLATIINFLDVTLNAGDCLYVPAYYYV